MTIEIQTGGKCEIYEKATRFELIPDPAGEDKRTVEISAPLIEASYNLAEIESFKAY